MASYVAALAAMIGLISSGPEAAATEYGAAAVETADATALAVDLAGSAEHIERDVRRVLRALAPELGRAPVLAPIAGGVTNVIFACQAAPDAAPVLTCRIYGRGTSALLDRGREMRVLPQLNAAGFGARFLAAFANGRLESFVPGRTLASPDLPAVAPRVARLLRRFHGVVIAGPGEPESSAAAGGELWTRLRSWLVKARAARARAGAPRRRRLESLGLGDATLAALGGEIESLEAACAPLGSPVVWSHCDVLAGNLILGSGSDEPSGTVKPGSLESGSLTLIDAEYGCWAPRGFDLGNHWAEWAGLTCDYAQSPSRAQRRSFCRAYLAESSRNIPESGNIPEPEISESEIESLDLEAVAHGLAAHLHWATWALIMAESGNDNDSTTDSATESLDYVTYAAARLAEYWRRKPAVWARLRSAGATA